MNINYTFAKTGAELATMIDNGINQVKNSSITIQVLCVAILAHAAKHGDYTGAHTLIMGLKDTGTRRNSLMKWFEVYGGLVRNTDKATAKDKLFSDWQGADYIKAHFEEAKATMWHKAIKEVEPAIMMDLEQDLQRVIDRYTREMKKAHSKGTDFRGEIRTELSEGLKTQIAQLSTTNPIIEASDEAVQKALAGQLANVA